MAKPGNIPSGSPTLLHTRFSPDLAQKQQTNTDVSSTQFPRLDYMHSSFAHALPPCKDSQNCSEPDLAVGVWLDYAASLSTYHPATTRHSSVWETQLGAIGRRALSGKGIQTAKFLKI